MCTAITYKTKDFYFGRTLDYEFSYGEKITITPRNYPFKFNYVKEMQSHYGIIGMACIADDYPLYYDAINEKGLCMAGLNFTNNAYYREKTKGKNNIAQFEFIPWILSQCKKVEEAITLLKNTNIVNTPFNETLPIAELHWIIADREKSITVESVKDGLNIYENQPGVLTNNPPFNMQMFNLNNYMRLSSKNPQNSFSKNLDLMCYSRGMGGLGIPGDLSSQSRFVRVAFTKEHSISGNSEMESISQFFHILGSVEQQKGCCQLENGEYEITIYTSCCNADKGIYYYTTYNNHQISAIDLHKEDLSGKNLIVYEPINREQIFLQN